MVKFRIFGSYLKRVYGNYTMLKVYFNTVKPVIYLLFLLVFTVGCKKTEEKVYTDNEANIPHKVSTIKVENYVNRCFIDLLGRTPLETELEAEVDTLKAKNLSKEARVDLVSRLQTDTTFRIGDSSYRIAYYQRMYDLVKARMCEGAADGEFLRYVGNASFSLKQARLLGDSVGVFRAMDIINRNQKVVDCRLDYRKGEITINEMFARMMDNNVYDVINMNTFNFVNASFDDLLYRFPSKAEFDIAYDIIQNNELGVLFGGAASNKREYCILLTESNDFYEGLIKWAYISLLARDPSPQEVHNHYEKIRSTGDFQQLQLDIVITDEYANF